MESTRREFMKMLAAGSAGLAALGVGYPPQSPLLKGGSLASLLEGGSLGLASARADAGRLDSTSPLEKGGLRGVRPNILFLMADQFRPDCLGCAGNSVIKTPNFDRIAREGAYFPHAYSTTPTCTPARAGLLTGLAPWHHGMLGYGALAERYPLEMQRCLHDAGYYTFAIGKLHYHPQRNYHGFDGALLDESGRAEPGFVSDYRQWFKAQAPDLNPDATGVGWNAYQSKKYVLPEELHPTHWMGAQASEFIEKYDKEQPFFLKVSFARPHSPYDPPKRFWDMYSEDDMPAPHVGKWAEKYAATNQPPDPNLWHGDLGVAQARRSRRGYYGSVSFVDEQVGHILKALEKKGILENTLILFTCDHGDMTGDHNLWRKSYAYESSARVPMVIRWPKSMSGAPRGSRIEEVVELRDVFPTFMDAARTPIPGKVDGDSILKLVRGEPYHWRPWIDLEHDICYGAENHWNALTDGRWKYIFHAQDGSEQLFDLKNDPGEMEDLSKEPSCCTSALKAWRHRMVEHLSERGEAFVKDGNLVKRPESMLYSPNFPG